MDLKAFEQATFTRREESIAVPQLKDFFAKGKKPVWKVRGLSGAELGWVNENQSRTDELRQLVVALAGNGDAAEKIRDYLDLDPNKVNAARSRLIDIVTVGSVDPEIGPDKRQVVVKLNEHHPGLIDLLAQAISRLTGMGSSPGKPKSSGRTRTSEPA